MSEQGFATAATDALAVGDVADVSDSLDTADSDANEGAPSADTESPYASVTDAEPAAVAAPAPPRRYVVCSARYRHTLKGPDRGKWEVTVTEEADAPLLTVDAVVRGVQRRSGDLDEIVRMTGDEVRAVLPVSA